MDNKEGVLIGEKGIKYGLQIQKPGAKKTHAAASASSKPKPVNVFGADSDSEEDVGAQVAKQADKKRAAAKVQQMYASALADDPSVFDYDGVYDSLQQERVAPRQQEKIERKSRYIAQLKDQAEVRKREADIAFERKNLKDRVKEDHLFADKEVFVTSAYRKKLQEQQMWIEEEKRKEEEEKKQDVRKVGHMANFYANLLSSNVAFGAAEPGKAAAAAAAAAGPAGPAAGAAGDGDEDAQGRGDGGESEGDGEGEGEAALVAAAAKAGVSLDKYDLMRMRAERAMKQRPGLGEPAAAAAAATAGAEEAPSQQQQGAAGEAHAAAAAAASVAGAAAEQAAAEQAAAAVAAAHAAKRRNDDSTVQSARERYLARKKQAT